ncbi:MAG: hypothetical protein GMKNLPBB_01575 [Myxococcota bacterium]|nr:hypothetical protein [Myxococcota bacterium]
MSVVFSCYHSLKEPSVQLRFPIIRSVLLVSAVSFAMAGCGDEVLNIVKSKLTVPEKLDFGLHPVGATASQQFMGKSTIANSTALKIRDVRLEGDDAKFFVIAARPDSISQDKPGEFLLEFKPTEGTETELRQYQARLIIESDAQNNQATVELTGSSGLPDIELRKTGETSAIANPIDMGTVGANTTRGIPMELINTGVAPLKVENIELEDPDKTFRMIEPTSFPFELTGKDGGGGKRGVQIQCAPLERKNHEAMMRIKSSDPNEGTLEYKLLCIGGDSGCPKPVIKIAKVARGQIGADNTIGTPNTIDLDGTDTKDPEGDTVAYRWFFEDKDIPSGSNAGFDGVGGKKDSRSARPSFDIDLVGTYKISLEARDKNGNACDPATLTINAVPSQKVHIELLWPTPKADLDVHLINTGGQGAEIWSSPCDAHWNNRNPDWGLRHAATAADFCKAPAAPADVESCNDDPSLDIDTTHMPRKCTPSEEKKYPDLCNAGAARDCETYISSKNVTDKAEQDEIRRLCAIALGPENINIVNPKPGLYRVLVHFFDGVFPTDARVRIFLNGVKLRPRNATNPEGDFAPSRKLTPNDLWDVGIVEWPADAETKNKDDFQKLIVETNAISGGVKQENGKVCVLPPGK